MEMKNFEEKLIEMTKPEVSQLKHQDMLENAITKAKDKSVISLWWLSIPFYLLAALIMKSRYVPHSSFISSFHELTESKGYLTIILFLATPVILIIVNTLSLRKLFHLYGNTKATWFIRTVITPILIIFLSLLILIIYFS
jgi:hypothetical protein